MTKDPHPNAASPAALFVLPKHLRFARSLALVSGAAIGITAGASLVTTSGCSCAGICGPQVYVPPQDATTDAVSSDALGASDASSDSSNASMADALLPDAGAGGGPLPAPPLPAAWLS